jgi:hypothetical protein
MNDASVMPALLPMRVRALIRRLAIALARQAAAEDDQAERERVKTDACCTLRPVQ